MPTSRRTSSMVLRWRQLQNLNDDAPALPVSMRLMQRSKVDLPLPDRAADHDAPHAHDFEVDAAQHVEGAEPLVEA